MSILDAYPDAGIINNKFEESERNMLTVNIIVTGKSGTGKSTLINTCLRKKVAEVGVGRPVTKRGTWLPEPPERSFPMRVYDTVGLELSENNKKATIDDMMEVIEQGNIHLMWYCVLSASNRLEQGEEDFIEAVTNRGIPVIIVLTQSFRKKQAETFLNEIKNIGTKAKDICIVVAEDEEEFNIKAFGKDELIKKTANLLKNDRLKESFINAGTNLELKRELSLEKIHLALAAAAAAAVVPVPLADSAMLFGIQAKMMADIAISYGVEFKKEDIVKLITTLGAAAGTGYAGRAIFSSLVKMIPGAGSVVGGVVGVSTAVVLTYALGRAYMYAMEKVFTGEFNIDNISSSFLKDAMNFYMNNASDYIRNHDISDFGKDDVDKFEEYMDSNTYNAENTLTDDVSIDNAKDIDLDSTQSKKGLLGKISGLYKRQS
ncbi:DUF697 domain-containing protein [Anaerovibrio sp. RM50]|uniref:DUF697 domain-containing protein n=1 Tax=Anaerovibrio sp. RM50 TaxID=1200557 RepID=UPI000487AAAA|nr:DUF697 domain-containing protein [Anaerovibrio sp. RM50]